MAENSTRYSQTKKGNDKDSPRNSSKYFHLRFIVPGDVQELAAIRERVEKQSASMNLSDEEAYQIVSAVDETCCARKRSRRRAQGPAACSKDATSVLGVRRGVQVRLAVAQKGSLRATESARARGDRPRPLPMRPLGGPDPRRWPRSRRGRRRTLRWQRGDLAHPSCCRPTGRRLPAGSSAGRIRSGPEVCRHATTKVK